MPSGGGWSQGSTSTAKQPQQNHTLFLLLKELLMFTSWTNWSKTSTIYKFIIVYLDSKCRTIGRSENQTCSNQRPFEGVCSASIPVKIWGGGIVPHAPPVPTALMWRWDKARKSSLESTVGETWLRFHMLKENQKFFEITYRKVTSSNASRFVTHLVFKHTQNDDFLNRSPSRL